jgi:hypothetical protein
VSQIVKSELLTECGTGRDNLRAWKRGYYKWIAVTDEDVELLGLAKIGSMIYWGTPRSLQRFCQSLQTCAQTTRPLTSLIFMSENEFQRCQARLTTIESAIGTDTWTALPFYEKMEYLEEQQMLDLVTNKDIPCRRACIQSWTDGYKDASPCEEDEELCGICSGVERVSDYMF